MSEPKAMELKFESPQKLNNAAESFQSKGTFWFHAKCKGDEKAASLKLDYSDWSITCPVCEEKARLDEWEVNESTYLMKMKPESAEGEFQELDYAFSVSMIGQMVPAGELLKYLKQLQSLYEVKPDDQNDNGDEGNEDEKEPKE